MSASMAHGGKSNMHAQAAKPLRILLVEDHHDTLEVVSHVLKLDGHYVRTAESFTTALASARAERFEVLLCDISLPDGDGCNLLAEIRNLYPIHAVALTARGMADEVRQIMAAGFEKFLLKPTDLIDIRAALAAMTVQIDGERTE